MACWAVAVVSSVPRASEMIVAPESTAKSTPWAKALSVAMKLSPTRIGSTMQLGQAPTSEEMASAAPAMSSASPVPCPYWTSS